MQLKKSHRFIAAFISFLLITTLCTSIFPVSAVDGGEMPPSQGGVEASTSEVDMGSLAETELTSKTQGTFSVTNATGEDLTFSKVLYKNSEGSFADAEYDKQKQCYDGNYFYVYGPNYINGSGEFVKQTYTIKPFTSGDKILTARDEPYTDTFQLVFTDARGNEHITKEVSVTLTVAKEGQHLMSLTAVNEHIYAYMSNDTDVNSIELSNFEITATDQDGTKIDFEELGLRIESRNPTQNNSVIFVFDPIKAESHQTITVTVKYKDDSSAKTAKFDVEGNVVESNIPESGNVTIKVIDNATKKPVPGVTVRLISSKEFSQTTDNDGYARFTGLPQAKYSLSIHADGYINVDMSDPKLNTDEVPVNLSRPGDLGEGEKSKIQVIVKNQYGKPVDGATVQFFCPANDGKGAAKTNAQGVATFELTANNYEITVTKSGHFPSGSKILSVTHKEEKLEITLEERFMCKVMTTVLDEDGRPVSGAEVYYTCPTDTDVGRSKTNSQGKTSEWISIRANDYILNVSKAGFETYERRVRVSEKNSEFSVTLERIRAVDDDDDDDDDSSSSGNSGSSGSSNGSVSVGGSSGSTTVNSKNQVVASEVNRQIQQGIREASSAGKSAVAEVKVKDAGSITPDALRSMRLTTEASKGKAKILADSTSSDGKVAARLYIDPEKSFYVDKEIKLGVSMEEKDIQKTSSTFEKYFDNNVSVVHFDHQGAFGMDIEAAVKVDLSKLNTQNLMFYSYNAATNRYTPIAAPNASIDKNGFLHFTTSLGGDLIITDKPLTPRS